MDDDEKKVDESDITWIRIPPPPKENAWSLSVITAFLRMAEDAKPFLKVTFGPETHVWFRMMRTVIFWTRVHFPLKQCERSMLPYAAYKSYMFSLETLPESDEACPRCFGYAMTVAVIIACEWMRNSAKVTFLLEPFPHSLKQLECNLWREFGEPPRNMDVPVSSTKNTDAARLRAPHLHMVAREIFEYAMRRKLSWDQPMSLNDLTFCLRLTTAAKLLRNHCYVVLHHLGMVPKLKLPTDAVSQGQNTRKFCTACSSPPRSLHLEVQRLLTKYQIWIELLDECPYSELA